MFKYNSMAAILVFALVGNPQIIKSLLSWCGS